MLFDYGSTIRFSTHTHGVSHIQSHANERKRESGREKRHIAAQITQPTPQIEADVYCCICLNDEIDKKKKLRITKIFSLFFFFFLFCTFFSLARRMCSFTHTHSSCDSQPAHFQLNTFYSYFCQWKMWRIFYSQSIDERKIFVKTCNKPWQEIQNERRVVNSSDKSRKQLDKKKRREKHICVRNPYRSQPFRSCRLFSKQLKLKYIAF